MYNQNCEQLQMYFFRVSTIYSKSEKVDSEIVIRIHGRGNFEFFKQLSL